MTNSRANGKRGELELAKVLLEHGYQARRTQQYSGTEGTSDVVGLPGLHIECKRVERLNIDDAMLQARTDANKEDKPGVFHRRNGGEWLVTMRLDDWVELYREWEAGRC